MLRPSLLPASVNYLTGATGKPAFSFVSHWGMAWFPGWDPEYLLVHSDGSLWLFPAPGSQAVPWALLLALTACHLPSSTPFSCILWLLEFLSIPKTCYVRQRSHFWIHSDGLFHWWTLICSCLSVSTPWGGSYHTATELGHANFSQWDNSKHDSSQFSWTHLPMSTSLSHPPLISCSC